MLLVKDSEEIQEEVKNIMATELWLFGHLLLVHYRFKILRICLFLCLFISLFLSLLLSLVFFFSIFVSFFFLSSSLYYSSLIIFSLTLSIFQLLVISFFLILQYYPSANKNNYYMLSSPDSFAMGGGKNFALYLVRTSISLF